MILAMLAAVALAMLAAVACAYQWGRADGAAGARAALAASALAARHRQRQADALPPLEWLVQTAPPTAPLRAAA